MIEVAVIIIAIAGITGWCLYVDEKTKKTQVKKKKTMPCTGCVNYKRQKNKSKSFYNLRIETAPKTRKRTV